MKISKNKFFLVFFTETYWPLISDSPDQTRVDRNEGELIQGIQVDIKFVEFDGEDSRGGRALGAREHQGRFLSPDRELKRFFPDRPFISPLGTG